MARVLSASPVGEVECLCPSCHYRIAYHPSEIVEYRDWDEGEDVRYVTCPQCKRRIDMPKPVEYDDI